MRRVLLVVLAALALGGALALGSVDEACANGGCGIMPFKPIIPLGCRDLVPVCSCDAYGNCSWTWQCVGG